MKLNIPFLSQNDSSISLDWKGRSCAVVCLKMCLDFYKQGIPAVEDLIKEGEIIGAYASGIGWKHDGLIRLAHNHGVPAYPEEFRSVKVSLESKTFSDSEFGDHLVNIGLQRIKDSINKNIPVIVAFLPGFGSVKNFHDLVVVGFEENQGFIVHDPSDSDPKESALIDEETFKKFWRKFAIFVG
jgi:hypothetical protein